MNIIKCFLYDIDNHLNIMDYKRKYELLRHTDLSVHCPEYFVAVCFFCFSRSLVKKT